MVPHPHKCELETRLDPTGLEKRIGHTHPQEGEAPGGAGQLQAHHTAGQPREGGREDGGGETDLVTGGERCNRPGASGLQKRPLYGRPVGLGHFGRGYLGRGHYGRGHLGRGHYGRGHFGRGHLGRGHFGPLIQRILYS